MEAIWKTMYDAATAVQKNRIISDYVEAVLATGAGCTIGSGTEIDAHQDLFLTTEELFK